MGPPGNHQAWPPVSAGAHQPHGVQRPTRPRGARASLGRPVKAAGGDGAGEDRPGRWGPGGGSWEARAPASPRTSARLCPRPRLLALLRRPRVRAGSRAAGKCECQHRDATFLRSRSLPRGCRPRLGPTRKAALVGPGLSRPQGLIPGTPSHQPAAALAAPEAPTPAGPRLSSVFPGGLRGCRCLQRAGYFGGHPLKENRAGMLEAEHPVPEAWVWRLELAKQEGREEAMEERERAGGGRAVAPRPRAQGRPSRGGLSLGEPAHLLGLLLSSAGWTSRPRRAGPG